MRAFVFLSVSAVVLMLGGVGAGAAPNAAPFQSQDCATTVTIGQTDPTDCITLDCTVRCDPQTMSDGSGGQYESCTCDGGPDEICCHLVYATPSGQPPAPEGIGECYDETLYPDCAEGECTETAEWTTPDGYTSYEASCK